MRPGRTTGSEAGPREIRNQHMRPEELGIGKLFGRIREAVIVADATTQRIVLWNPAATNIFGYSISEALELNIEKLVPDPLTRIIHERSIGLPLAYRKSAEYAGKVAYSLHFQLDTLKT